MNKKIYLKILIILFYITIFFSIGNTFGDDTCNKMFDKMKTGDNRSNKAPICTSSPDFIDKYFSDNINILNKISGESTSSTGINALGAKTLQTTFGSIGITLMFGTSGMGDFFQNFWILKEDLNVVRDWTKIINFKQYITKKTLLASSKGILLNNVPQNIIKQIDSSNNFILDSYSIHTYKDLFSYLWVNQMAFEKIYYDKIVLLNKKEEIENGIIGKYGKKGINIIHLDNIISKINKNYFKGDEKIECNTPWDDFMDALKNITCNLGGDKLSRASERFSSSYNRLGTAIGSLSWSDLDLTKKLKLNVSIEGVGKIDVTKGIGKLIGSDVFTLKGAESIGSNIVDGAISAGEGAVSLRGGVKTIINFRSGYRIRTKNGGDSAIIDTGYFNNQIENIQSQITEDYDNSTKKFMKIEPSSITNGITPLFPEISYNIYKIIKKIDDESNGIYELTAKACENQSPFAGSCRY